MEIVLGEQIEPPTTTEECGNGASALIYCRIMVKSSQENRSLLLHINTEINDRPLLCHQSITRIEITHSERTELMGN